eukprot:TRINITY_DN3988_c0_g1_i1.p1 TRINITY_DN3988_c0_g1~~TRINITY_DN3988_c0_g1_i1.p1  ORF type:complete len:129 (+),score=29.38 TRINITY_DN3988_c0_g1_i1:3-389(+)
MWRTMRSQKTSSDGYSAYSVFNKGLKPLPGTFSASQFDDQLRGGFAGPSVTQDNQEKPVQAFQGAGHVLGSSPGISSPANTIQRPSVTTNKPPQKQKVIPPVRKPSQPKTTTTNPLLSSDLAELLNQK